MESALQIPFSRLLEHLSNALLLLQPTDSSSGWKLHSSTLTLSSPSMPTTALSTKFPTSFATKNKRKTPFWGGQWYIFIFHVQAKMMEIWSISWCVFPRPRLLQLSLNDWGAGRGASLMSAVRNHISWITWPSLGFRSLCLAILSVTAVNSWHGTMRVIIHRYYNHFTEIGSHNKIQSNINILFASSIC